MTQKQIEEQIYAINKVTREVQKNKKQAKEFIKTMKQKRKHINYLHSSIG
jgi:hypothetical protein